MNAYVHETWRGIGRSFAELPHFAIGPIHDAAVLENFRETGKRGYTLDGTQAFRTISAHIDSRLGVCDNPRDLKAFFSDGPGNYNDTRPVYTDLARMNEYTNVWYYLQAKALTRLAELGEQKMVHRITRRMDNLEGRGYFQNGGRGGAHFESGPAFVSLAFVLSDILE